MSTAADAARSTAWYIKRMRLLLIILLFGRLDLESATQGSAPIDWERADRATVRLSPSAFPELPDAVRRELKHRDCVIPQAFSNRAPHNIVRGLRRRLTKIGRFCVRGARYRQSWSFAAARSRLCSNWLASLIATICRMWDLAV